MLLLHVEVAVVAKRTRQHNVHGAGLEESSRICDDRMQG